MKRKHFDYIVPKSLGRGDDEEEEEEKEREDKRDDLVMLNKKLEKIFFEKRSIYLWGVVDDKSAREVTTKMMLLEYDKPGDEIKFYINSPGGVVTSGMVMYDTMRMIKSPVTTICMGLAASMGSILLSGGVKGKRYIYPHGEVMIHQPSLGGHIRGVSADLEIQAEQTRRVKEIGARILAENCGKTIEQIMRDFDRDYAFCVETSFRVEGASEPLAGHFLLLPDIASLRSIFDAIRLP
jgi:ATP-dependent Clp protease protease subunit